MSGLFEHISAFDEQAQIAQRQAVAVAHKRFNDRFSSFLKNASSDAEFNHRLALVDNDVKAMVADVAAEYEADALKVEAAIKSAISATRVAGCNCGDDCDGNCDCSGEHCSCKKTAKGKKDEADWEKAQDEEQESAQKSTVPPWLKKEDDDEDQEDGGNRKSHTHTADLTSQPVVHPVPLAEEAGYPEEGIDETLADAPSAIGTGVTSSHQVLSADPFGFDPSNMFKLPNAKPGDSKVVPIPNAKPGEQPKAQPLANPFDINQNNPLGRMPEGHPAAPAKTPELHSDQNIFADVPKGGTLQVGSEGTPVKALQQALGIKADGQFGKATQQAVQNYQKQNDLKVDGVVGEQTAGQILSDTTHRGVSPIPAPGPMSGGWPGGAPGSNPAAPAPAAPAAPANPFGNPFAPIGLTSAAHEVEQKGKKYYVVEDGDEKAAGPFDSKEEAEARANKLNGLENLEKDSSVTETMLKVQEMMAHEAHRQSMASPVMIPGLTNPQFQQGMGQAAQGLGQAAEGFVQPYAQGAEKALNALGEGAKTFGEGFTEGVQNAGPAAAIPGVGLGAGLMHGIGEFFEGDDEDKKPAAPTAPAPAAPAAPKTPAAPAPHTPPVAGGGTAPWNNFDADKQTYGMGDQGKQVEQIQQHLINSGYMRKGTDDGQFGKNTEAALRKFQADKGLTTDGTFGQQTLRAFQGQQGEKAAPKVTPGGIKGDKFDNDQGRQGFSSVHTADKPETGDSYEEREKLPKGNEDAHDGPSPKMDKTKWKPNATNPDGNLKPIDSEHDKSPYPTHQQDINQKPDYDNDDIAEHDNKVWKREQLPTAKDNDAAGFEKTKNVKDQPTKAAETWHNMDGQTKAVTRVSLPDALSRDTKD